MEEIVDILNVKPERLDPRLYKGLYKCGGEFFIKHLLYYDINEPVQPFEESVHNASINVRFRKNYKLYASYLRKKDYESVLMLLDKDNLMPWFNKFHKKIFNQYGEDKYYQLLAEMLTCVDHHEPFRIAYKKLLSMGTCTRALMSAKEQTLYDRLPATLTVFRGVCLKKPIDVITKKQQRLLVGHSWTLKMKKAVWFATHHGPKYTPPPYSRAILSYQIQKCDTLAYFYEGGEYEIFIEPQKINLSKIQIQLLPS